MSLKSLLFLCVFAFTMPVLAQGVPGEAPPEDEVGEFNPYIETEPGAPIDDAWRGGCYREGCRVWAFIDKSTQHLYLYIDGSLRAAWPVSTGMRGFTTPNMDTHPSGRVYTSYTSRRYPEGDYMGLGNMPYAVFIRGGYAIHGTPTGNWSRLGRPASHGCIRLHPTYAEYFNQLVRSVGAANTWITVR